VVGADAPPYAGVKSYARLLPAVVSAGRVDYDRLRSEYGTALDDFLNHAADVEPDKLARDERLAHYLNLYNATMLMAVIQRRTEGPFQPSDRKFDVFDEPRVRTKTGVISLNDLENKIIRPTFKDPRVHAALCCAAVSCPPLIDKPYTAAALERQLDENVTSWLADPGRNVIDDKARTLRLSKIFDWYADDFGGRANVARWVAEKTGRAVGGYKVEFLEYDWTLNSK
ncbi:MAG TPA: DUF547 domain-containing protein, partial [Tepidisphaeraceae bacterium]